MYEVGVVAQFEAAHRLVGDFGPATRTHGHTYRVEVAVRGETLASDGTLSDIAALQGAVNQATGDLHYRDLSELDAFEAQNSTAEAVARHLFDRIAARLDWDGLTALSVRVWESPQAYAAFEGRPG
jgi:6-pyruvoyltetrahydropterin/6-carboxytetrahydropterin synthase